MFIKFYFLLFLFFVQYFNYQVMASVSMNKKGDLLLSSLLQGDVVLTAGSGDIIFQSNVDSISLLSLVQMMDEVSGQICYQTPKSPPPVWNSLQDIPLAISGFATVVIGSNIYSIGGLDANNISSPTLFIFNTLSNTWSTGPAMTYPRSFPFAASNGDGSQIYTFGGFNLSLGGPQDILAVEVYDVYANQWSVAPITFQNNIYHRRGCSAVVNNVIYFFGGVLTSDDVTPIANVSSFDLDLLVWNPPGNEMINPRYLATAFGIDTAIYVAGGNDGTFETNAFDLYDTTSDTWTSLGMTASLPASQSSSVVLEKLGFVMGGYSGVLMINDGLMDGIITFNNRINGWNPSLVPSLTSLRKNCGAAVVLGNIYVIGGETNGTTVATTESIAPCF